jgi:uncharacterized PurR-regulated membrane protein YhhQ (DUF165 family)
MTTRVVLLTLYGVSVFVANFMILHVGATIPGGTHVVPVGFGLVAPSGTYVAAFVLVLRDLVQRSSGRLWGLAVIVPGIAITALMSPRLALASGVAFALGEVLDFGVYTPLSRRLGPALFASCLAGAVLDTFTFLLLAGIPLAIALPGTLLGKAWVALLAWPLGTFGRRMIPARVEAA